MRASSRALGSLLLLSSSCATFVTACGDDDADGPPIDAGGDVRPPGNDGGPDTGPTEDAGPDGATPDAGLSPAQRDECEGIHATHCLFPWPSSRFLVDDPGTETGRRLEIPAAALPRNRGGDPTSPDAWEGFDGFSPMTSVITTFAGEIDESNLADETRIDASLEPGSPTVWIDAETGERVPHFAELDHWPQAEADRRSFYMRPAARLLENHRYVVAIRDIRRTDGTAVEASDAFRALRDDEPTDFPTIEARRERYEEIFGILEGAGVERDGLIEAWDFHTASGSNAWGPLISMRDDALERIGERGVGCTVTEVRDDVNEEIWRQITGTFTIPLYMESEYENTRAHRDGEGNVTFNRMAEAPFTVVIPRSVRDAAMAGEAAAPILVYGHGLLGTSDQVASRGARTFLQRAGMIGVATDWWGLSEPDETVVVTEWITDVGNFPVIGERLMQGVLNFAVLARSFRGVCGDLPELAVMDGVSAAGDELYYYGISQGGIMGASLAGISPDIERYALQVGAISYPIMIRRSVDFEQFEVIYRTWYPDKLDRDWAIVAMQNAFDLSDPATFAPHLLADPLPGGRAQRILYQTSRYDTEVSNAASDIAARTMGLPWLNSSVYEPWNVASTTAGPSDSAYVIYHVAGVAPIPMGTAIAAEDNDAHGELRFREPVLEQLERFLRPDGRVEDTCGGDCTLTAP
ncbi:MAG: hypothetical protein IT379_25190 [Deltaproteobacteria bacterium]|nr:hypothetical protein [Deltaproteobacteria bacterium]